MLLAPTELTARRLVQGALNELATDDALLKLNLTNETDVYIVNSKQLKAFRGVPLETTIDALKLLDYRIIGARTVTASNGQKKFFPRQLVLWRRNKVDELVIIFLHERRTTGFIWMAAQCFVNEILEEFERSTGRALRRWPGGLVFSRVHPVLMRELERYGGNSVELFQYVVKGKHRRIVAY